MKQSPCKKPRAPGLTLIVERHPLWLAGALDARESDGAVVSINAGADQPAAGKVGLLVESVASSECVLGIVFLTFYGRPLARLDVQVVHVVPVNAEILLRVVNVQWQPDVSALPERVRVPLQKTG